MRKDAGARRTALQLGRIAGAVTVAVLLLWLAVAPGGARGRIARLNAALRTGTIGRLPREDALRLRAEIVWLAQHAAVGVPVVLNEPYRRGRLHVYTTSEIVKSFTRCDRGNAVYDAQLDAIFIDETLVRLDDFRSIYEASGASGVLSMSEVPFFSVFQRFIILHELGHRQLHRASGGVFDSVSPDDAPQPAAREREADAFALARLKSAYAADAATGFRHTATNAGGLIDVTLDASAPASERLAVDIAGMAAGMGVFNLFLSTPYGPFYQDRVHPPFLARARGALENVLREPLPAELRAHVAFFDAFIAREATTAGAAAVEVLFQEPIQDMVFTKDGLLVAGSAYRRMYRIADDALVRREPHAPSTIRVDTAAAITATRSGDIVRWWTTADDVQAWNGRAVLAFRGYSWVPTAIAAGATSVEPLVQTVPHRTTMIRASMGGVDQYIVSSANRRHTVATADIKRAIGALVSSTTVDIDLKGFTGNEDLVFAVERENALWGVAIVTPASKAVTAHRIVLPDVAVSRISAHHLAILPTATGARTLVVIQPPVGETEKPHWEAWEVSAGPPRRIGAHDLLLAHASAPVHPTLLRDHTPLLLGASAISRDVLLVSFEGDSMYALDVRRGTARVVFHPGDSSFVVRNDGHGRVAVMVPGGHKVILVTAGN